MHGVIVSTCTLPIYKAPFSLPIFVNTRFFYTHHVFKQNAAAITQKLRKIYETQAGWVSNNNLQNCIY